MGNLIGADHLSVVDRPAVIYISCLHSQSKHVGQIRQATTPRPLRCAHHREHQSDWKVKSELSEVAPRAHRIAAGDWIWMVISIFTVRHTLLVLSHLPLRPAAWPGCLHSPRLNRDNDFSTSLKARPFPGYNSKIISCTYLFLKTIFLVCLRFFQGLLT